MSCSNKCCSPRIIPNQISIQWETVDTPIFPYASDQIATLSGYVLNNSSSKGPVTVNFIRSGGLLPFSLIVQEGVYKSFVVIGVDTLRMDSGGSFASGELNITINFNPF
ncbi:hypothetical protein [Alkalihalobacillus sp. BA299]|uniref:hypothetical protein n=1 Tax=Alkalihalobacillus sp. BA299 TaxID=2815938 RepID=UPI001ADB53CD|nr:hypothetical protein [Alkalihalobacillus sp. BA299]